MASVLLRSSLLLIAGASAIVLTSCGGGRDTRNKMIGRGVLLDVARFKGVDVLPDGYGISNEELDACAAAQGVEVRRGDFVIIRTGQLERMGEAEVEAVLEGGSASIPFHERASIFLQACIGLQGIVHEAHGHEGGW